MKKMMLVLAVLAFGLGAGLKAEEEAEQGKKGGSIEDKKFSVGIELGMPLLVGAEAAYEIIPRFSLGVGGTAMGNFTVLTFNGRFNLKPDNFRPYLSAGYTMYTVTNPADSKDYVSTGLMNASFGIEYAWDQGFAVGMEVGYHKAMNYSVSIVGQDGGGSWIGENYAVVLPNLQIRAYF